MATLREKIDAERRFREFLASGDVPEPDRIEYGYTCIRAFWDLEKVVVVLDIDEAPDDSLAA